MVNKKQKKNLMIIAGVLILLYFISNQGQKEGILSKGCIVNGQGEMLCYTIYQPGKKIAVAVTPSTPEPNAPVTAWFDFHISLREEHFLENAIGNSYFWVNGPGEPWFQWGEWNIQQMIEDEVNSLGQATCVDPGCSFTVQLDFNAPPEEGVYQSFYRVWENNYPPPAAVIDEDVLSTFTVQAVPTECPVDSDWGSWTWDQDIANGEWQTRTRIVYTPFPDCVQQNEYEYRTVCDTGYNAEGFDTNIGTGWVNCVLAPDCSTDADCDAAAGEVCSSGSCIFTDTTCFGEGREIVDGKKICTSAGSEIYLCVGTTLQADDLCGHSTSCTSGQIVPDETACCPVACSNGCTSDGYTCAAVFNGSCTSNIDCVATQYCSGGFCIDKGCEFSGYECNPTTYQYRTCENFQLSQWWDPVVGICGVECIAHSNCDDSNSCTTDTCSATYQCSNSVNPDGSTCTTPSGSQGACNSGVCTETSTCPPPGGCSGIDRQCNADNTGYYLCLDTGAVDHTGFPINCLTDEYICPVGSCVANGTTADCREEDACAINQTECTDSTHYRSCSSGTWGTPVACGAGEVCTAGVCETNTSNGGTCSPACSSGQVCTNGVCVDSDGNQTSIPEGCADLLQVEDSVTGECKTNPVILYVGLFMLFMILMKSFGGKKS